MTPPTRIFALFAAALACALIAAGCGSDSGESGGKPVVVATTTQLADFAREVGGDDVVVKQILGPNSDPHEYEPRPSDAAAVADAKLVLQSGGDLDEWLDGVIDNAGGDAKVLKLTDGFVRTRKLHGELDPHWWQDPRNAWLAVRAIRNSLEMIDSKDEAAFADRAAVYMRRLDRLALSTRACVNQLPRSQRKLVTTHDALGYYADRYGLDVIGALIPSLSTEAQPNAKDTRELVDQIEETGTKAVFPESSVNPKLEEAVARETDATIGKPLYADTLGPKGSAGATYVGSIEANTRAIVSGLSGGKLSCG